MALRLVLPLLLLLLLPLAHLPLAHLPLAHLPLAHLPLAHLPLAHLPLLPLERLPGRAKTHWNRALACGWRLRQRQCQYPVVVRRDRLIGVDVAGKLNLLANLRPTRPHVNAARAFGGGYLSRALNRHDVPP